jgi:hypothetical protein
MTEEDTDQGAGGAQAPRPPAPDMPCASRTGVVPEDSSVPIRLIAQLHLLEQRGAITPEEFSAAKRHLLLQLDAISRRLAELSP